MIQNEMKRVNDRKLNFNTLEQINLKVVWFNAFILYGISTSVNYYLNRLQKFIRSKPNYRRKYEDKSKRPHCP